MQTKISHIKLKVSIRTAQIIYILFVLLFCYIIIRINHIGYESNDDFYLSLIPSGFLGDYYPYTIHNNIIVGFLLATLSRIFHAFNCTTVFYLVGIIVSYCLLGVCLISKKGAVIGSLFSYIIFFLTYGSLIEKMNYSKSAIVIILSGFVAFANLLVSEKSKYYLSKLCLSGGWFVLGSLIRYKTTIAAVPFLLLMVLFFIDKSSLTQLIHSLKPFVILFTLVVLLWGVDYSVYHINPEWNTYKKFNDVREALMDYGKPDYEHHSAQYEQLNLSITELELLNNWIFADNQVYNADTFEKILEFKEKRSLSKQAIKEIIRSYFDLSKTYYHIITTIYIICIIGIALSKDNFIYSASALLFMIVELCYLLYAGRFPDRAVMITCISALICMILFCCQSEMVDDTPNLRIGLLIVLGFCILYGKLYHAPIESAYTEENHKATVQFLEYLNSNTGNLYVWEIFSSDASLSSAYAPLDKLDFGLYKNSVLAGGWPAQTPFMAEHAAPFGEPYNILKLLATNPNVYLVSYGETSKDLLVEYLRHYYSENAVCNLVEEKDGYYIYSLYSTAE